MTELDFSLNGINASTKYFSTARIIKPVLPQQEQTIFDIPGKPGTTQSFKKFKLRPITISGTLEGTDPDDLITNLQNLSAYLYSDTDKQLIFSNEDDRYYNAQYLDYSEVLREGSYSLLDLKFTCNDPFGYAITPDADTKSNITAKNYIWTITNSGQYYAFPIITITFKQGQSHIYLQNNNINDCRFDISKAFISNDVLVLDTKTMSITLNNLYSPTGFGDGGSKKTEFIILKTGSNELEVGTDDSTIKVDVGVWFRKTYL